jgi:hypothetical protein
MLPAFELLIPDFTLSRVMEEGYIALPCVSVFWRQDGQGGSLMSFVEKVVAQFARPTGFFGNIAGAHRRNHSPRSSA